MGHHREKDGHAAVFTSQRHTIHHSRDPYPSKC